MATIAFDTLKFVQTLKNSGISEKQAEAITAAFSEAHQSAELATKVDVDTIRRDMKEMELRLTVKMGAFLAAAVALVAALVKLL